MINFIISFIFGAMLDSLFYFLYIVKVKKIQNKKILLYVLILIGYVIFNMILRYNFYLYLLFLIYIFFVIKILYKNSICDIFLLLVVDMYSIICSIISYFCLNDYILALVINKALLFIPLVFSSNLSKVYTLYLNYWNRKKEKVKIKSITLRNISILLLNIFIISTYIVLLFLING